MAKRISASIKRTNFQTGFTLIEILIVLAALTLVATLSTSTWTSALGQWEVNNARNTVDLAIRNTQISAQSHKENWQFSIHETIAGHVEWSSHAQKTQPSVWHALGTNDVDIDLADTTLDRSNGSYYVRFNYKGYLASRTRTLTLTHRKAPAIKRCVVMSTLLGKIRNGKEHQRSSSSGRYCY